MTTFYFIRHATNDFLGRAIAGRQPHVHLSEEGKRQAGRVAEHLRIGAIKHIFSSPMERCTETGTPLAQALGLEIKISEALNEVDFGDWTNAGMAALDRDPRWQQWNAFRSGHATPRGESMIAIQARIVSEMIRLRDDFPGEHIALCSHGDPIRAAVCYWLGMPLDFIHRLQVDPASISVVSLDGSAAVVHSMNVVAG